MCRKRDPEQVGKALLWLPWFVVNQFLQAFEMAEDILGKPPTLMHVLAVFEDNFNSPFKNIYQVSAITTSIMREDLIFFDKLFYRWTVHKKEGFFSYSEIFALKFGPGYAHFHSNGTVYATTARTINYDWLKQTLTSRDESAFTDNKWVWDGNFRFLDKSVPLNGAAANRINFTSFPRSGNSFLRHYVEQISGVTTGSTMNIHTATSL